MQDHRVESWLELHDLLYAGSWNEELGVFRSSYAYRGHSDAGGDLRSGLLRLGGDTALERSGLEGLRRNARVVLDNIR